MSSLLPPGYSFEDEDETTPKVKRPGVDSLLPPGYSFADEETPEERTPEPEPEKPGLLARAAQKAKDLYGSRTDPHSPPREPGPPAAAPTPPTQPMSFAPLPKNRVSKYAPPGTDQIKNEPIVSEAEYAIKHLPPTPGTKPYLETPLSPESKAALAATPKNVSMFAGKGPKENVQTTGGDAGEVAARAAKDLAVSADELVTGKAPSEEAKKGTPLYPDKPKGWHPTTEPPATKPMGQILQQVMAYTDPALAAAGAGETETELPTGEVKKGTPLYAGQNQNPTTVSGGPQTLAEGAERLLTTELPTGEVSPGVPLYGGAQGRQAVNQAPVTTPGGLTKLAAGVLQGAAGAADSLASPEVLALVVAMPAVAALLPAKAASVLSMAVTGKFGYDIAQSLATEKMTELGDAIVSKDPQKIAKALTGIAFDLGMLIHPTRETPQAAEQRWRTRLEAKQAAGPAPEGAVLTPELAGTKLAPEAPAPPKPGWTAGGMVPSLIAEAKNIGRAFAPPPEPLQEIPVFTPPKPPGLQGDLDPEYTRPGTGPKPEEPTIPPRPDDIVIPPVGPPPREGPIVTPPPEPGRPPAPPEAPPAEPPPAPTAEIKPEPHDIQPGPEHVGGERWSQNRGAMPGEPIATLDGDAETGKAAVIEVEPEPGQGAHYEAWTSDGINLGKFTTAQDAAKAAEEFVDSPEPRSELIKRLELKRNPPTPVEEGIAKGEPPDVAPPAPGPEETTQPEPVSPEGPPAAEGVGGEAPAEPDGGSISPGGRVSGDEPPVEGPARAEGPPGGRPGGGAEDTAPVTRLPEKLGNKTTVHTQKGYKAETQWAIVPLEDILSSHDSGLNPIETYPKVLQPRIHSRQDSQNRRDRYLNQMNPELLAESALAGDGAPVLGPDLTADTGNTRLSALKLGYETSHPNMEKYRGMIEEKAAGLGLDPADARAIAHPVLVRVETKHFDTKKDRVDFAGDANAPSVAEMSPSENAMADAPRLTPALMEAFHPDEDGDLMVPANREFLAKFSSEIIGPAQAGSYQTKDGLPNSKLIDRVTNAFLAKAYNDLTLVELLSEAVDPAAKNVGKALIAAASGFSILKHKIAAGSVHPLDISKEAAEAAKIFSSLKAQAKTVDQFLRQDDLYAAKPDPVTERLLRYYDKNARSAKRITALLNGFTAVVEGMGDPRETDMFGGGKTPTMQEALDAAHTLALRSAGIDTQTGDMFAGKQAGGGAGAGEAGGGGAGEAPPAPTEGGEPAPPAPRTEEPVAPPTGGILKGRVKAKKGKAAGPPTTIEPLAEGVERWEWAPTTISDGAIEDIGPITPELYEKFYDQIHKRNEYSEPAPKVSLEDFTRDNLYDTHISVYTRKNDSRPPSIKTGTLADLRPKLSVGSTAAKRIDAGPPAEKPKAAPPVEIDKGRLAELDKQQGELNERLRKDEISLVEHNVLSMEISQEEEAVRNGHSLRQRADHRELVEKHREWLKTHPEKAMRIRYFSGTNSASLQDLGKRRPGEIGLMVTPATASLLNHAENYEVIAIDNGAFQATGFIPEKFTKLIERVAADPELKKKVAFVVAPDVPGHFKATLDKFPEWSKKIRDLGLPVAFAFQDGAEMAWHQVPWDDMDVAFVGGSTEWKLGEEAKRKGVGVENVSAWLDLWREANLSDIPIHVGRVNSKERLDLAKAMGAASVDGTFIKHGGDQNVSRVEEWLKPVNGGVDETRSILQQRLDAKKKAEAPPEDEAAEKHKKFLAEREAQKAKIDARVDAINKAAGDSDAVRFKKEGDARTKVLSRSTDPDQLPWRVTSFDEKGPSGHIEYKTREEAIRELALDGFEVMEAAKAKPAPSIADFKDELEKGNWLLKTPENRVVAVLKPADLTQAGRDFRMFELVRWTGDDGGVMPYSHGEDSTFRKWFESRFDKSLRYSKTGEPSRQSETGFIQTVSADAPFLVSPEGPLPVPRNAPPPSIEDRLIAAGVPEADAKEMAPGLTEAAAEWEKEGNGTPDSFIQNVLDEIKAQAAPEEEPTGGGGISMAPQLGMFGGDITWESIPGPGKWSKPNYRLISDGEPTDYGVIWAGHPTAHRPYYLEAPSLEGKPIVAYRTVLEAKKALVDLYRADNGDSGISYAPDEPAPPAKPSALDFAKKFLQKKDTKQADLFGSIVDKVGSHAGTAPSEPGSLGPSGKGEAPGGRGEAGREPVLPGPTDAVGGGAGGLRTGQGPLGPAGGHAGGPRVPAAGEGPVVPDRGPAGGPDGPPRGLEEIETPGGGGRPVPDAPSEDAGDAAKLSADNPGLTVGDTGLQADTGELTEAIYENYKPQRVNVPGMQPHGTKLVESAAMASVMPPEYNYEHSIPQKVIESGDISDAQLEAIIMSGAAHAEVLPSGFRKASMVGDGTGVGKGREAAGIILDNWYKDRRRHIWLTQGWHLFESAQRDLADVGMDPNLLINLKGVNASKKLPDQNGILFLTYSSLRSGAARPTHFITGMGARTRVTQLIEWFGPGQPGGYEYDDTLAHGGLLSPGGFSPGDRVNFHELGAGTSMARSGKFIRIIFPSEPVPDVIVDYLGEEMRILGQRVESIDGDAMWKTHVHTMRPTKKQPKEPTGGGGVIIFDESHEMGNAGGTDPDTHGAIAASQQAKAGLDLQTAAPNARITFMSATGATEVSNLAYAGERLHLWGEGTAFKSRDSFISQVSESGTAGMEVIARDMKALGVYVSRLLSYEGVGYERETHELDEKQIASYNEMSKTWRHTLEDLRAALRLTSSFRSGVVDPAAKSKATRLFYGTQLRFFDQVSTAMQMPTIIKRMERAFAEDHAPVVSFVNTNEAAMERQLSAMEADDSLDDLDMTPREAYTQYLTKHFPVIQMREERDPKTHKPILVPVIDPATGNPRLNPEAVAMRDRLIEKFKTIDVPDNPMDMVLSHFGPDKIAEVSGRKRRVVTVNGKTVVQTRSKNDNAEEVRAFQNDEKRGLMYSPAGGTGASYHADKKVKNQRLRIHIPAQHGYRANIAMQRLGRTHRARQKQPPLYDLISTDLPGQKRFASTIARRMEHQGALGRGERKTGGQGLFGELDNLESTHAKDALRRFIKDLIEGEIDDLSARELETATGLRLRARDGGAVSTPPEMSRFLNRILALEVEMQHKVFDAFYERFKENIELAIENGTLDVGLENLKAEKVEKTSEQVVYTHPKSKAETKYMTLDVHRKHHIIPFPGEQAASTRFIKNKRSGHVWAMDKTPIVRTDKEGKTTVKYRVTGPAGTQFEDRDNLTIDGPMYEKTGRGRFVEVSAGDAKTKWEEQSKELPEFRTIQMHLITGAILPIWDKLTGKDVRVMRVRLATGETMLGRIIPPKELDATLAALGAKKPKIVLSPKQVYEKVLGAKYHVALDNGWKVVRKVVGDKARVELEGPGAGDTAELTKAGVAFERIQFKPRFHVPSAAVLEKVLEQHPIAESAPPKETGVLGAPKKGVAAEAPRTQEQIQVSILQALAAVRGVAKEEGVTLTDAEAREVARRARAEVQRGEGGEAGPEGGGAAAPQEAVEPGQVQAAEGSGLGDQRKARQGAVRASAGIPADREAGVAGEDSEVSGIPTGSRPQRETMEHKTVKKGKVEAIDILVRAEEIIKHLQTLAGTPIRIGHGLFARRKAAAWFNPKNDLIRMKVANDIDSASHEVGHSIDQKINAKDYASMPKAAKADLIRLGKELYGPRVPNGGYASEGWAEYIAQRVRGDNVAGSAPDIHKWFENEFLPRHEWLRTGLNEAQEMFDAYDKQGAAGRIASQIHNLPSTPTEKLKAGYQKLMSMAWRRMWTAQQAPMDDAVARLIAENPDIEITAESNPSVVYAALAMSAKGTAKHAIFEATVDITGEATGDSLAKVLEPVKDDLFGFLVFAVASRGLILHARKINPGFTRADAEHTVEQLRTPERVKALEDFTAWSDRILDYLIQSGGLSVRAAKIIRLLNPLYVPFQRYFDETYLGGGKGTGAGRGMVNLAQAVKGFKGGSGRAIQNSLEVAIQQAEKLILMGNKMQVAVAIAEFSEKMPGSASFANQVPAPQVPEKFTIKDIAKQLEEAGIDLGELSEDDLEQVLTVFHAAPRYFGKDNVVSIWRGGKRQFWDIVDPDVYRIVTEMDKEYTIPWILSAPKRLVQLGATGLSPGFSLISNPTRDSMVWNVYAKTKHLGPHQAFEGLWDELRKAPAAQRWKAGGGEMGTLMGQDRAAAKRHLDEAMAKGWKEKGWVTVKHPIDALRQAMGVFESGPRIKIYKDTYEAELKKNGGNKRAAHLVALYESKDGTVNFTRMGTIAKAINQLTPFFNARIQGASKFYRTFGGSEYKGEPASSRKARAMRASARAFEWITVPSILLWYMNKDEEWYRELPGWQKGAFWVFSPDHGKTKYRIPKPMELGYVFGSIPEALLDHAYRGNPRGVSDAVWGTINSLLPFNLSEGVNGLLDLLPAAIKPIVEVGANIDTFKNHKIVDSWMEERKVPKDQYHKYTTATAIALGQAFNVSPAKLEHFASSSTGGLGLSFLQAIDLMAGHRKKGKSEGGLADIPVLNRLAVRNAPGVSVDDLYEREKDLAQKRGSNRITLRERTELRILEQTKAEITEVRRMVDQGLLTREQGNDRMTSLAKTALRFSPAGTSHALGGTP